MFKIILTSFCVVLGFASACGRVSSQPARDDSHVATPTTSSATPPDSTTLRVSVLGDSYSTFEGWIPQGYIAWYKPVPKPGRPTDVTDVDQTWWKMYIDDNGYVLDTNNSYSGSTVCNTGYEGADYSDRSFVNRTSLLGNPDIIFVFGGTNDDWAGVPLGEYVWSDWQPSQLYSFRPAAARMASELISEYPNAHIVFVINDAISAPVKESTVEICRHYDLPYVMLEDVDKMSGHPSSVGMRQIADQIEQTFKP